MSAADGHGNPFRVPLAQLEREHVARTAQVVLVADGAGPPPAGLPGPAGGDGPADAGGDAD